jgi:hypothetical protein
MVGRQVLTIQDGITKSTIVAGHANLGTETPSALFGLAILWRLVAMFRFHAFATFFFHFFLRHIVHIRQSIGNQLQGIAMNGLKVVGRKGHDIGLDTEQSVSDSEDDAVVREVSVVVVEEDVG